MEDFPESHRKPLPTRSVKLGLTNLPHDQMYEICEKLSLADLNSFARINDGTSKICQNILTKRMNEQIEYFTKKFYPENFKYGYENWKRLIKLLVESQSLDESLYILHFMDSDKYVFIPEVIFKGNLSRAILKAADFIPQRHYSNEKYGDPINIFKYIQLSLSKHDFEESDNELLQTIYIIVSESDGGTENDIQLFKAGMI